MTHAYTIFGMTCKNCVAKVKGQLLTVAGIETANVQLEAPQAILTMQEHIPVTALQGAINRAGQYTITEADGGMKNDIAASWMVTYKPVLLIFAFLTGVTILTQLLHHPFNLVICIQHFMAGFFLIFSFFKLLDIKSFADSYAMYDLIAQKWHGWGYIYPFAELAIGIAYLVAPGYFLTNIIMVAVMLVSIAGVLRAIFNKRKIQCACLGAVFNLPMSTITVIEDGLMIGMGIVMLLTIA